VTSPGILDQVNLVLDTSAILGFVRENDAVGELIREVADAGLLVALPTACMAEAYLSAVTVDLLQVLVANPATVLLSDEPGEWVANAQVRIAMPAAQRRRQPRCPAQGSLAGGTTNNCDASGRVLVVSATLFPSRRLAVRTGVLVGSFIRSRSSTRRRARRRFDRAGPAAFHRLTMA
jgi:hypothetical protein